MDSFTAEQASTLANYFLQLAQVVTDFKFTNWNMLHDDQKSKLGKMQQTILSDGQDMLALSTTLVMDDIQDSLAQLHDLTSSIQKTMAGLNNINKGITIIATIISLSGAILSRDPKAITSAVQNLTTVYQSSVSNSKIKS